MLFYFFFSHLACNINVLRTMRGINFKVCLYFDGGRILEASSVPSKETIMSSRGKHWSERG